jgi:hypothetical protein
VVATILCLSCPKKRVDRSITTKKEKRKKIAERQGKREHKLFIVIGNKESLINNS